MMDDVHLWTWRLSTAGDLRTHRAFSADERERAARFRFDTDRNRFLAARLGTRHILGRYLRRAPEAIAFAYCDHGKPKVAGPFEFSLSHSEDLATLAIAQFGVGVDIERVRKIDYGFAERFFSADEIAGLRALPAEKRIDAFFACWTRKEAYVKALGQGLSIPLHRFSVSVQPGEPARLLRAYQDEECAWQLSHFSPAPGFVGAVAARQRGWRLIFHNYTNGR
jgi:4'-phosphopantetheinyl transferase